MMKGWMSFKIVTHVFVHHNVEREQHPPETDATLHSVFRVKFFTSPGDVLQYNLLFHKRGSEAISRTSTSFQI